MLAGFGRLVSAVAARPFAVENPFFWLTKTDVVRVIADAGCGDLIGPSTSCGRTWGMTTEHPHCGECSQCIDRRFAVLAAGQEAHDPDKQYGVDLLFGARPDDLSRTLATSYYRLAEQIEDMTPDHFFRRFGEVYRALTYLGPDTEAAAGRVFDLYRRHAAQVTGVVDGAIAHECRSVRRRRVPATCLLRLIYDGSGGEAGDEDPPDPPGRGAEASDVPPPNSIQFRDGFWRIRFEGEEERVYPAHTGFEYLQLILQRPGHTFDVAELDGLIQHRHADPARRVAGPADFGGEGPPITAGAAGAPMMDARARAAATRELSRLDELIEAARHSDSPTRLDEIEDLQARRVRIAATVHAATGLNGRPRLLGDERKKTRDRVNVAIRRALTQIQKYDPRLAAHLAQPILCLGATIRYTPAPGVVWLTGGCPTRYDFFCRTGDTSCRAFTSGQRPTTRAPPGHPGTTGRPERVRRSDCPVRRDIERHTPQLYSAD